MDYAKAQHTSTLAKKNLAKRIARVSGICLAGGAGAAFLGLASTFLATPIIVSALCSAVFGVTSLCIWNSSNHKLEDIENSNNPERLRDLSESLGRNAVNRALSAIKNHELLNQAELPWLMMATDEDLEKLPAGLRVDIVRAQIVYNIRFHPGDDTGIEVISPEGIDRFIKIYGEESALKTILPFRQLSGRTFGSRFIQSLSRESQHELGVVYDYLGEPYGWQTQAGNSASTINHEVSGLVNPDASVKAIQDNRVLSYKILKDLAKNNFVSAGYNQWSAETSPIVFEYDTVKVATDDSVYEARMNVVNGIRLRMKGNAKDVRDAAEGLCSAMQQLAEANRKTGNDLGGQMKTVFNKIAGGIAHIIDIYDTTLKNDDANSRMIRAFRDCTVVLQQQIPNADEESRLDMDIAIQVLNDEVHQYGPVSLSGARQPVPQV